MSQNNIKTKLTKEEIYHYTDKLHKLERTLEKDIYNHSIFSSKSLTDLIQQQSYLQGYRNALYDIQQTTDVFKQTFYQKIKQNEREIYGDIDD